MAGCVANRSSLESEIARIPVCVCRMMSYKMEHEVADSCNIPGFLASSVVAHDGESNHSMHARQVIKLRWWRRSRNALIASPFQATFCPGFTAHGMPTVLYFSHSPKSDDGTRRLGQWGRCCATRATAGSSRIEIRRPTLVIVTCKPHLLGPTFTAHHT